MVGLYFFLFFQNLKLGVEGLFILSKNYSRSVREPYFFDAQSKGRAVYYSGRLILTRHDPEMWGECGGWGWVYTRGCVLILEILRYISLSLSASLYHPLSNPPHTLSHLTTLYLTFTHYVSPYHTISHHGALCITLPLFCTIHSTSCLT